MLALEAPQKGYVKEVIDGKYEMSKSGVLVHKRTRKAVKGHLDKKGYIYDGFNVNGKTINIYRHRLVYETFIGEIPKDMEVNHINEIKTDNRLDNLNLLTHKANICWGTCIERIAKARSKSVIQKSLDGEIIKIWPSAREIQRKLGYAHQNISNCCRGKFTQSYGYKWEYAEE